MREARGLIDRSLLELAVNLPEVASKLVMGDIHKWVIVLS